MATRRRPAPRLILLGLSTLPLPLAAQEAAEPLMLPEVVVYGGGLTPVDGRSYARAATIVTAEELERRNPRTFADALRAAPGVSVSRSGGPGGTTAIRIRGGEARHTLVLIDGVKVSDTGLGADLATLSPDLIERIEVLRGPQSAIYGSGATTGVVNIITKGGLRDDVRVSGSVEGSTAPGGRGTALMQGGTESASAALGLSIINDSGWDASGQGGEKDGLRNQTLNFRGDADLAPFVTLRGSARYTNRTGEFDPAGVGPRDDYLRDAAGYRIEGEDLFGSVALDVETLGGALVHTPSVAYSSIDQFAFDDFPFSTQGSTLTARYRAVYAFDPEGRHKLAGAVEYERLFLEDAPEEERDQIGYALDYQGQLTDALFVQGGLRFDDNEDFDDFLSFSASASYEFFETGTRLRGSIGRAQNNPTLFDLAPPFGNPDLEPERNFGWDIGVDQTLIDGRLTASATYFSERLEDEISFDFTASPSTFNDPGESTRRGVELSLEATPLDRLTVSASYTYLDAREEDGFQEVRRPKHAAGLSAFYSFPGDRASVGLELTYNGQTRQVEPINRVERITVDEYLVVDLNARYRLTDEVEVYGGINNLLDADYEDVSGYAEQPLTAFLGLRAAF